jgi:cytochrome c oxidase cbb3-type subunit I
MSHETEERSLAINPFWMMAALFVTAGLFFAVLQGLGAVPGMPGPSNLRWLRVHLITIGTITQMIFASLPGLLARRLGLPGRAPGETWLQWALLNGGFLLIIAGLVGIDAWTAAAGATLVFVAVWRLLNGILAAWKASGRTWRDSVRFYATAPLYLMTGIVAALGLLFNWWAPGGRQGWVEVHVHANVWGFLALVVAGMLSDIFPALVGGPMARPGWTGRIYTLLNLGLIGLIVGPWVNYHVITVAGLVTYFVGTAHLILNLALTLLARRKATPASLHMPLAYLWMIVPAFFAPFIVMAPQFVHPAAVESAATQGLVNGWVLGMVMGALPLVLRTRGGRNDGTVFTAEPNGQDGTWVSLVGLNLGVALVWATAVVTAPTAVQVLTIGGYTLIAAAWIPFLRRIWPLVTGMQKAASA